MVSQNKTFTEVVTTAMRPAAHIIVYCIQPSTGELLVDSLIFPVSMAKVSICQRLFLKEPRGCLRFVIVIFTDHTHYFLYNLLT